ncbi:MAG TPA: hypothetical protein VFW33_12310 [Gemmataceae bacterium]|nr:hypothetical protein [Gemmataceae bacterium]
MDVSMGAILLLVTGFLWVVGAVLHWHNIRRQERLLLRMRRMSGPHGKSARREHVSRARAVAPADDRLTAAAARR